MKKRIWNLYIALISWLVRRYARRMKPYTIGITGSVGKTTCRMIVAQTLTSLFPDKKIVTSPKNFNGELGFLLSVLDITGFSPSVKSFVHLFFRAFSCGLLGGGEGMDIFVGEYGIDTKGEMEQLVAVLPPDVAIVTRVDSVHSLQLGDEDSIAYEKGFLAASARDIVYLNADDHRVAAMSQRVSCDTLFFGTGNDVSHRVANIDFYREESVVEAHADYYVGEKEYSLVSTIYSSTEHLYISLGLSIAGLIAAREGLDFALPVRIDYDLQPGRSTFLRGICDSVLLDSSYNAAPASMSMMLDFVGGIQWSLFAGYQTVLVLGDMRELGELSEEKHLLLANDIIAVNPRAVLLVGKEVATTYQALQDKGIEHVSVFAHSRDAGAYLHNFLQEDETPSLVFFKGSQNTIYLEDAIERVLADPDDVSLLGRQESWWKKRKNSWFARFDS